MTGGKTVAWIQDDRTPRQRQRYFVRLRNVQYSQRDSVYTHLMIYYVSAIRLVAGKLGDIDLSFFTTHLSTTEELLSTSISPYNMSSHTLCWI